MTRVALLLDVDGVILPYRAGETSADPWPASSWRTLDVVAGYGLAHSTEMIDRLRDLTALPGIDPQWCTTWGSRAATVLAPALGMGEDWPSLDGDGAGAFSGQDWWKAACARDSLASHEALVWIDDMLDGWREQIALVGASQPEDWPGRVLTVCPQPTEGLTPAQLDLIEDFVTDVLGSPRRGSGHE